MNSKGVIVFFLVVIALCIYVFCYLSPAPKKVSKRAPARTPAVKIAPKVADYRAACRQVNDVLLAKCQSLGGRGKDVIIRKEHLIHQEKGQWLYTETDVFLPRKADLALAADSICEAVKQISGFFCQFDKGAEERGDLAISLKGVVTHTIHLIRKPPQLAIIIDDIGEDLTTTKAFLNLGFPLTLSILPDLPDSIKSEEIAHQHGYEVMLHLPMEPKNSYVHDPGKEAIMSSMPEEEVHRTVMNQLSKFKYIKGVNNHMGSRVTEDEKTTRWVLGTLKSTGLYFIDSRTTPRSKAYEIVQELGIPGGTNSAFLDTEPGAENCKTEIGKVLEHVKRDGTGIVIAHPHYTTLRALGEMSEKIREQGISLVFVSELVR